MSEAETVSAKIETLKGKSEQRQRARFTRKPDAVPRFTKGKPFELSLSLRDDTLDQLSCNMAFLRFNIKYLSHKRGSNVAQLVRDLAKVGINVSRKGITYGGYKRSVQLTYLTTMALALRVPTWVMIHPDIESIWDSLNLD